MATNQRFGFQARLTSQIRRSSAPAPQPAVSSSGSSGGGGEATAAAVAVANDGPAPQTRWWATVVALNDAGTAASVTVVEGESPIWAPLEVSGATAGDRCVLDFRLDGYLAVTAVIQ